MICAITFSSIYTFSKPIERCSCLVACVLALCELPILDLILFLFQFADLFQGLRVFSKYPFSAVPFVDLIVPANRTNAIFNDAYSRMTLALEVLEG
jgi:hypothetical protein